MSAPPSKVVIYDALSHLRVRMETEKPSDFLQGVLNEAANPFGTRIWVWDGPGGNKARRALFPAYKTSREYKPGIIKAMDFVRELIALTGSWQVRVPGFEGDDVVAALVNHFHATTDLPIEIVCRDGDLAALCAINPQRIRCSHQVKVPYHQIALYKLCVGDPSDDIPGIKGFGKGAWEKADKANLGQFLTNLLDARRPAADLEEGLALSLGMSKASFHWLQVQENIDALGAMRRIIAPLPVSADLINQYLHRGERDEAALMAKLSEFML